MTDGSGGGVRRLEGPFQAPHFDEGVGAQSDAQLIIGIAQGSHDALAAAHSRHAHRVEAMAQHLCGAEQADDVVQHVFLSLWHDPASFEVGRGSLESFLLMQTHRRAVEVLRDHRISDGSAVDEGSLAELAGKSAWQLLARAGHRERQAIVLAYFGGHTYRDIAALLDEPEGTILQRMRRGLSRMRSEAPTAAHAR